MDSFSINYRKRTKRFIRNYSSFLLFFKGNREYFAFPSKTFLKPDNYIFADNEMTFKPLSNYEIKVFRSAFEELSKYSIEKMIKSIK
jgi:hypothetical protein